MQVYARCSNLLGAGSVSPQLSARTEGQKPVPPPREDQGATRFLLASNDSVRYAVFKKTAFLWEND